MHTMSSPGLPPSSSVAPPVLTLPATDLFERRARRLRQLADGHSLGDWLRAMAALCDAQARLDAVTDTQPAALTQAIAASRHAVGALERPEVRAALLAALPLTLDRLGAALAGTDGAVLVADLDRFAPEVRVARGAAQLDWAAGSPDALPSQRIDVLVGAALQVLAAGALRGLPVPVALSPLAGPQVCPCCGSAAQAGVVLAAEGKAGLRYLECSLCGSRWNAVRARCTLCDDPHEVTYQGLEGHHPGVLAETCDGCHGYIKTMFRDKDPQVEPLADDLATLALDVLVGEAGHGRAAPHLFLLAGDLGG